MLNGTEEKMGKDSMSTISKFDIYRNALLNDGQPDVRWK